MINIFFTKNRGSFSDNWTWKCALGMARRSKEFCNDKRIKLHMLFWNDQSTYCNGISFCVHWPFSRRSRRFLILFIVSKTQILNLNTICSINCSIACDLGIKERSIYKGLFQNIEFNGILSDSNCSLGKFANRLIHFSLSQLNKLTFPKNKREIENLQNTFKLMFHISKGFELVQMQIIKIGWVCVKKIFHSFKNFSKILHKNRCFDPPVFWLVSCWNFGCFGMFCRKFSMSCTRELFQRISEQISKTMGEYDQLFKINQKIWRSLKLFSVILIM